MKQLVIYIHGKGGDPGEAEHYKPLFEGSDVIGFDYVSNDPQSAKKEFSEYFDKVSAGYDSVILIANSIGAFFAMSSLSEKKIDRALLISPIVDMERLISDMMMWAGVTEEELSERGEISTEFGEVLSYKYLCYVRDNPVMWNVPTYILYGERDNLTAFETISEFAGRINAPLTVMKDGEHWFHTEEQMKFLDEWVRNSIK